MHARACRRARERASRGGEKIGKESPPLPPYAHAREQGRKEVKGNDGRIQIGEVRNLLLSHKRTRVCSREKEEMSAEEMSAEEREREIYKETVLCSLLFFSLIFYLF